MTATLALQESDAQILPPSNDLDIVDELVLGRMPKAFQRQLGRSTRCLLNTNLLALLPTVSPLLHGHVLIFSKPDVASYANLFATYPHARADLSSVMIEYEARFGPAIGFEHGCSSVGMGACGVTRAHIHLLPHSAIDHRALSEAVMEELGRPSLLAVDAFSRDFRNNEYIALGSFINGLQVWRRSGIASQVMRRLISEQLGLPQWDWRELFSWGLVEKTIKSWERGR